MMNVGRWRVGGPPLALIGFGCGDLGAQTQDLSDDPPAHGHSTADSSVAVDSETTTMGGSDALSATCEATDNALRRLCMVNVRDAQDVQLRYWPDGEPDQAFTLVANDVAEQHLFEVLLLRPNTVYRWEAQALDTPAATPPTGSFTTLPLPSDNQAVITVTGESTLDYVIFRSPCDSYAMIADTQGRPVWYERIDDDTGEIVESLSWTEDGTILASTASRIVEVDLFGERRLTLKKGEHFTDSVHHDVHRKDGRTYALIREGQTVDAGLITVDGLLVFEGDEQIARWGLKDVLVPQGVPPGDGDHTHGNSVWVGDDGTALLSLRHLSTVLAIDGDPDSPTFGAVQWGLAGSASDADPGYPNDFVLVDADGATEDFEEQHHAHLLPDGTLALFDNRSISSDAARVLNIRLDAEAAVATVVGAYSLPDDCEFQGGSHHTLAGNPIGTCAPPLAEAFEFDGNTEETVWNAQFMCENMPSRYVPRVAPWIPPSSISGVEELQ